ncbi:MAG: winged helix-turn-helix domain-containing protein [bacterium]
MEKIVSNLKALGSIRRLAILKQLNSKSCCVNEIADHLGVSQNTVSYHLSKLKREGYIKELRKSRFTIYSISPSLSTSKLLKQITL